MTLDQNGLNVTEQRSTLVPFTLKLKHEINLPKILYLSSDADIDLCNLNGDHCSISSLQRLFEITEES